MSYSPDVSEKNTNKVAVKSKIYSLLLKMGRESIIHMGIYVSLDEAYEGAMSEIYGDKLSLGIESRLPMEMWTSIDISEIPNAEVVFQEEVPLNQGEDGILEELHVEKTPPTIKEYVDMIRETKNNLMNAIIESCKTGDVTRASSVLTPEERKFLRNKIKERNGKTTN